MTYCVGLLVRDGLVLVADTRTNAGIDNISIYRKLHVLADDGERQIFAATAGSLSVTQSALSMLAEGLADRSGAGDETTPARRIAGCTTMFRVAQLVGEALTTARGSVGQTLAGTRISSNVSMLLGGRMRVQGAASDGVRSPWGPLSLFLIYNEGNFIECQPDAPFLQIGELKYGKPILDRTLTYDTPLEEAMKVALISFDSTMRSNLSVGLPLDVVAIPADPQRATLLMRLGVDDPYFNALSQQWGCVLSEGRATIADPPFMLMPADEAAREAA